MRTMEGTDIKIIGWDFVRTEPCGAEPSGMLAMFGRPYVAPQTAAEQPPADGQQQERRDE